MADRGDIADDNLNDILEKRNNKASCSIPNKRRTSSYSSCRLLVMKSDMSHLGYGAKNVHFMTSLMDLKYDGGGGYLSTLYWLCGWREERAPTPPHLFSTGALFLRGRGRTGGKASY